MNTKVRFLMTLMCVFAVIGVTSCSKENDDNDDGNTLTNTINAKWEISGSNSAYASFEFNKDGNYIVVENEAIKKSSVTGQLKSSLFQNSKSFVTSKSATRSSTSDSNLSPIHFGTYKIEGDKIILTGFGTLDVISITAEEFTFSFTLEATGEKGTYVASKAAEPISASSRTDMLCRTWKIQEISIDESLIPDEDKAYYIEVYGVNWKVELEKSMAEEIVGATILFSKAGTYLVLYVSEEHAAGLSEWKWANKEETAIYYSWENWEDDWEEDGIVQIKELSDTTLKMQEDYWAYELVLTR
ncbi:MAG: hypothetical protein LBT29_00445 [Flavobacteriaceae bacterium]|jgi:hypothetical protein|nr:hypothetical protein [Flavobacteriaceae bacterium]